MNIGMMGLGKLGLPCALAMESKGHFVTGYDTSTYVQEQIRKKEWHYKDETRWEGQKDSR